MSTKKKLTGLRKMLGHGSIYAFGNLSRQLVGFIMLPIYTRYLTPSDYGVIALMTFALSLIELIFGARLGQAIQKYYFDAKGDADKHTVISTAMIITGLVSFITATTLIILRAPVSLGIYDTTEYSLIVGFFAVTILTQALEFYALLYLRLLQRPWPYVTANLLKLAVQLLLNIWLVVSLDMGVLGVAIGAATSSAIFAVILVLFTVSRVGLSFDRTLALKMLRFSWPLWLGGFAGLYIGSANRYYLKEFSSFEDVGLLELAAKFGAIVSMLVWQPFITFWQTERFVYYHKGNSEHVFQAVFLLISSLLLLTAAAVSLFAPIVITIMADQSFHSAGKAVPFLAFSSVLSSLIPFMNFSFLVTEKTGWLSRNNYITALILTAFMLILIPAAGFVGASIAMLLTFIFQFLIVFSASRKSYDMKISLKMFSFMFLCSFSVAIFSSYIAEPFSVTYRLLINSLLLVLLVCFFLILSQQSNQYVRNKTREVFRYFFSASHK